MTPVMSAEDAIKAWMEEEADRQEASRRVEADAAKVVATFASAVGASLVASALEVGRTNGLDRAAATLLGVSVLLTVVVVIADRRVAVDVLAVLRRARIEDWDDAAAGSSQVWMLDQTGSAIPRPYRADRPTAGVSSQHRQTGLRP